MTWFYSETRWRINLRCPREYYCHYRLSKGGFFPDAPAPARQAHLLKSLQTVDQCAIKIARSALTELLRNFPYGEQELNFAELKKIAERYFCSTERAITQERYLLDHSEPIIDQIYYHPETFASTMERLHQQVLAIVDGLTANAVSKPLARSHAFYETESPCIAMLSDICCYFDPVGILPYAGKLYFLDFAQPKARNITSLLHKYYANSRFSMAPNKVFSVFIDPQSGLYTLWDHNSLNVTEELNNICNRAFEIADKMPERDLDDFLQLPGAPKSVCSHCRFQEICKK